MRANDKENNHDLFYSGVVRPEQHKNLRSRIFSDLSKLKGYNLCINARYTKNNYQGKIYSPQEYAQKDEDDLMPYELVNYKEKCFLEKRMSPEDIKLVMAENYCKLSNELISTYVDRFFNLWQRNQWKRERYAPSFLVDDISLDPKTWCRYPILSGSLLK